jgi:hypothetical protein
VADAEVDPVIVRFDEEEIDLLITFGCLAIRRISSDPLVVDSHNKSTQQYWLSHPTLPIVFRSLLAVETFFKQTIGRKKYKELNEKELNKAFESATSIPDSSKSLFPEKTGPRVQTVFPLDYHLLDLFGREIIRAVAAPDDRGRIFRLCS